MTNEEIDAAIQKAVYDGDVHEWISNEERAIFRAGMEAAEVCDAKAAEIDPGDLGLANNRKGGIACGICAAAIREAAQI